ncbi:Endo-1,4-beta-xylanase Z [Methylorubrum aminovorans]|uniref:Beta-xylanase n=1 Tax=Methylorubrum aminovorans TaxID=269069 RepID=A0ABQ4UBY6_9HYPH|nr:endo-1,4-beta-xylanase [Methylorubrum aminovorans]GJE64533.1 Endo-1,4-beta-xylanase Z [Methylorubrum aminovorans]
MTQPSHIDRRAALKGVVFGTAVLAAGPDSSAAPAAPASSSTGKPGPAARARSVAPLGTPIGCAVQASLLDQDAGYRRAILRDCDLVVTEDALKWDRLRPTRGAFDFTEGDAIVRFARNVGLAVRGHALVFHGQVPPWLDTVRSRAEAEAELRKHIANVVGHYRGAITSWDVVNEFTDDAPERGTGLRNTLWRRLIGDGYIEMSLRAAAQADPAAQLLLSDYFLEFEGEHYDSRRAVMLRTVQGLVARGVPLHGVGMQGHLYSDRVIDRAAVARFVAEVRALGLVVVVTELDVIDQTFPADLRQRDELVAQQAFQLLDAIAEGGGADAVLTWGLRDRDSWTRWHKPRLDGLPTRSLPLDDDLKPKPLHEVMQHFRRRVPTEGRSPGLGCSQGRAGGLAGTTP